MAEITELSTPLYQRVGENLKKLHLETIASQVKMKNAEQGDSDVQQEIEALRQAMGNVSVNGALLFKGVVNQDSDIAAADYKAGWTYMAGTVGTYKGKSCEAGDIIVCVKDYADPAADADWTVIQTNIPHPVSGPESAADGNLAAFDGDTGGTVKDSGLAMAELSDAAAKRHEHANQTDVLDKLSAEDGKLKFDGQPIGGDEMVDVAVSASSDTIPPNLRDGGLLIVDATVGA